VEEKPSPTCQVRAPILGSEEGGEESSEGEKRRKRADIQVEFDGPSTLDPESGRWYEILSTSASEDTPSDGVNDWD
jgi:hypothetical protein